MNRKHKRAYKIVLAPIVFCILAIGIAMYVGGK
jgi:hypothetical protein